MDEELKVQIIVATISVLCTLVLLIPTYAFMFSLMPFNQCVQNTDSKFACGALFAAPLFFFLGQAGIVIAVIYARNKSKRREENKI